MRCYNNIFTGWKLYPTNTRTDRSQPYINMNTFNKNYFSNIKEWTYLWFSLTSDLCAKFYKNHFFVFKRYTSLFHRRSCLTIGLCSFHVASVIICAMHVSILLDYIYFFQLRFWNFWRVWVNCFKSVINMLKRFNTITYISGFWQTSSLSETLAKSYLCVDHRV